MLSNVNCYISTVLFQNLPFRVIIHKNHILVQVGMVNVMLTDNLKKHLRGIDNCRFTKMCQKDTQRTLNMRRNYNQEPVNKNKRREHSGCKH